MRAADRLRLPGAGMSGRALLDVRDTRGRLGRAMRTARRRRALGDTAAAAVAIAPAADVPRTARRLRRRWIVAGVLALVLIGLILLFLLWPRPSEEEPGGGLPPLQQQVQVIQREILRGRSVLLPSQAPVAVVTPAPSAPPTPTPTQFERPDTGGGGGSPVGVPGGTGTGTGGSGTGSGSGSGSGSGPGTPRPPLRTQAPPPASIPPGFGRLTIQTVDGPTGANLPDVCLVVGSGSCAPGKPHTDGAGRWWVDLPLSQPNTNFDVTFIMPGYTTDFRRFVVLQGQTVTYVVRLQPTSISRD